MESSKSICRYDTKLVIHRTLEADASSANKIPIECGLKSNRVTDIEDPTI